MTKFIRCSVRNCHKRAIVSIGAMGSKVPIRHSCSSEHTMLIMRHLHDIGLYRGMWTKGVNLANR